MTAVTFGETNPALEQFVTWYRERPTQLAFAASLLLHALLIAFIPGFRSVPLETPSVLTVQIVNTEPVPEKIQVNHGVMCRLLNAQKYEQTHRGGE